MPTAGRRKIRQTVAAVDEKAEVGRTEGLVIDDVFMTEHLLVDPAIAEFWDYEQADWMIQTVPMKKAVAEGLYGFCLDKGDGLPPSGRSDREFRTPFRGSASGSGG